MNYLNHYYIFLKTEKKLGDATIESYKLDLNSFKDTINKNLNKITTDDILDYLSKLRKELNPRSVNRHISALKGFYTYMVEEKIITTSPLENISVLKTEKSLPKYLTIKEVEQV